jgi:hypothetical protein
MVMIPSQQGRDFSPMSLTNSSVLWNETALGVRGDLDRLDLNTYVLPSDWDTKIPEREPETSAISGVLAQTS